MIENNAIRNLSVGWISGIRTVGGGGGRLNLVSREVPQTQSAKFTLV